MLLVNAIVCRKPGRLCSVHCLNFLYDVRCKNLIPRLGDTLRLTVLVPSCNRTSALENCLRALAGQTRVPEQVLLVVREEDQATLAMAAAWADRLPLVLEKVTLPGQVNALNAGLRAATGDIISITDDDAAPRPYWLQKIEKHFEKDASLGGVGGRDFVHDGSGDSDRTADVVGMVRWFGRPVGNHHLGAGDAREVYFIKGANMSYRRSALDGLFFDERLRGEGAQVCNDMAFSLTLRKNGWKLLYDPAVSVDHYPAPRFDFTGRGVFDPNAAEITAHNQYWALATGMAPGRERTIACAFQLLVGNRSLPGYLQLARGIFRKDKMVWDRWRAAQKGRDLARQRLREQ
jgi:cellulose synthase/poly-beta-1,6-N-acetylglucosamine synthase-like glycosyltransferase